MGVSQQTQKVILTFFVFFNGLITPGGIIYGWPGLSQMLKDEGQYSSDCPVPYDPKGTCEDQDTHLDHVFSVAANLATVSTIVYGFTLDRWGVRSNAFSGAVLMCAGFIMLAYSNTVGDSQFDGFIPGFSMIAFGGLGTYLPAFQFSSLFERPQRVLSMQGALFGFSGLTFTFFKFLYEDHGITRKTAFLFYAGLIAFCGLNMLLLYPKKSYRPGDTIHLPVLGWLGLQAPPAESLDDSVLNGSDNTKAQSGDYSPLKDESDPADNIKPVQIDVFPTDKSLGSPTQPDPSGSKLLSSEIEIAYLKSERALRDLTPAEFTSLKNSRSLKDEVMDLGTVLLALHFSVSLLCCNLYNAHINTLLKNMGDTDSKFTNAFVYITSLWPMGFSLCIDEFHKRIRYAGNSFLSTTFLILGTAALYINNPYVQLPAFFFIASGRVLFITLMFSFVSVEYRADHYGRIIAFVTAICACIGLLQLAMDGPANKNFTPFTTGIIITLTSLYYFSYWCYQRRI